jgi:CBS domain-containing protein
MEHKVSTLPVLKGDTVVGIITHRDILRNPDEEQLAILMNRNVVTTEPGITLNELVKLFIETGFRRLPVVSKGKLMGIVAIPDVVEAISQMKIETPVGELAGDGVVAVWDQTPVNVVAEILHLSERDALPVLNTEMELIGVIGITDILSFVSIEDKVRETAMSAGTDEDAWSWESFRDTMKLYYGVSSVSLPDKKVADVMVRDVETAFHQTTTSECALKMSRKNIEQVPIINADGRLRGMVTDRDIIKAITIL